MHDAAQAGTTLEHPDGCVRLHPAAGGLRIEARPADPARFSPCLEWTTRYPVPLIEALLAVKGPCWLCDEIRREEDPRYVEHHLRHDLLGHLAPEAFAGRRLLELGCGAGASTLVLRRLLPRTEVVAVELEPSLLRLARLRAELLGATGITFRISPSPTGLPDDLGPYDFVLLSAVFEHLLPDERRALLPRLWAGLRPGGVLFLDQTPHRWFPIEGHTTGLPLINYLPTPVAAWAASHLSPRTRGQSWSELLRNGIRGGTIADVVRLLGGQGGERPEVVAPARLGLRDHLDLWYRGGNGLDTGPNRRRKLRVLRAVRRLTGWTLVPNIAVAIRRPAAQAGAQPGAQPGAQAAAQGSQPIPRRRASTG